MYTHKPRYKLDFLEEIEELMKKAERFKKSGNRAMYFAVLEQINRRQQRFHKS